MKQEIVSQGAEAIIYQKGNEIIKQRIKKSYRHSEIDEKLRKLRTRSEAKSLEKLRKVIPVPKLTKVDEANKEILIEFINGKKLSENLENFDYNEISRKIADNLSKMHNLDIIHGDLTTSNMILNKENKKLYFIDFGLSFHSKKIEDKAVDLHLLKQALESKHYTISEECFNTFIKNYKAKDYKKILQQLKKVESRGRYKGRY